MCKLQTGTGKLKQGEWVENNSSMSCEISTPFPYFQSSMVKKSSHDFGFRRLLIVIDARETLGSRVSMLDFEIDDFNVFYQTLFFNL